jgi:archaellum biogenesis ATPase FlaH
VRKRWPDRKIYVAADNDKSGTGLKAAQKAVQAGQLDGILLPPFKDDDKASDWNDFCNIYGSTALVEAIRRQKGNSLVLPEPETDSSGLINGNMPSTALAKVNFGELYTTNLDPDAPPIQRVAGLFPRGAVTLLYGKPGSGKTLFLHSLSADIAKGGMLMSCAICNEPEPPRRVLFLEGDADKSLFDERARLFSFETPSNLRFVFLSKLQQHGLDMNLSMPEGQNLLSDFVNDFQPEVIIIDTIQAFHTKDENDAAQVKVILEPLVRLATSKNLAVVSVHHARKSPPQVLNTRLNDESSQGSNMFTRRVGVAISLEKLASGDKTIHSISIKKDWYGATRDDIAGFEICPNFYEDSLSLRYIRAPQINAPNIGGRPSKSEAVRDAIATLGKGDFTVRELFEMLPGTGKTTIQSALSAMAGRGELTRTGHGKNVGYRLNL